MMQFKNKYTNNCLKVIIAYTAGQYCRAGSVGETFIPPGYLPPQKEIIALKGMMMESWRGGGYRQKQGSFQIRTMRPRDRKSGASSILLLEIGSEPRDFESHLLGTPQDCAAFSVKNGAWLIFACPQYLTWA